MNHIAVQNIKALYEYKDNNWTIDGKALTEYLNAWVGTDLDFTCTEIVCEIDMTKDFVYWNRIGYVAHEMEKAEDEKIKDEKAEDEEAEGEKAKDEKIKDEKAEGEEEKGNVCWLKEVDWVFDRFEYDKMVKMLREMELVKRLEKFPENIVLDIASCANLLADLTMDGRELLQNHLEDYGEVLLHLLGSELITEPLIDLLKHHTNREIMIQIYCRAIEVMWKNGNAEVVNVVDVTILERLSDEADVWQKFGTYISKEFKDYINNEVLRTNLMMGGVGPL